MENNGKKQKDAIGERHHSSDSGDQNEIIAAINRIAEKYKAPEHQSCGEKWFKRTIEILTVIGIWAAAGVAIWAINKTTEDAREQRNIMQGQLTQMQADQRAWLPSPTFKVEPPFEYRGEGDKRVAIVHFSYTRQNVGRSPAFDYFLDVWPFIIPGEKTHIGWVPNQSKVCDYDLKYLRTHPTDHYVVLPGTTGIPFEGKFTREIPIGTRRFYTVNFLGCITYKAAGSDKRYQSGVIFMLSAPGKPDENGVFKPIDAAKPITDVGKQLQIAHSYTAGRAN